MKRHPALLQLSREHHTALKLSRQARLAVEAGDPASISATAQMIARIFPAELEPHFQAEENSLLPALAALGETVLVERTLAEHANLRHLARQLTLDAESDALRRFGALLEQHVRFEERALFESAQQHHIFMDR